ncbi:MAG TPA: hypothetical protein VH189_14400, partial [Rhizomicrobium sp.]|nr:hypothetical protein [Rhizomicrobium sp.]
MPDGWFDADFSEPEGPTDIDPGFSPGQGHASFVPKRGSIFDGLPDVDAGSSLNWFMDPKDILTIPGLPQHVNDQATKDQQASASANDGGDYASSLDRVSLAPH